MISKPNHKPLSENDIYALAIMVDCQMHTPKDPWSYRLWYYTKKPVDQRIRRYLMYCNETQNFQPMSFHIGCGNATEITITSHGRLGQEHETKF